jgi:transcriptional regulator with XRE-family HTH domain
MIQLQHKLRSLRESRHLTLSQAAKLSKGSISAIALGSYERGDRAITATKLLSIAEMYGLPISELFYSPEKDVSGYRVTIDLRKLTRSDTSISIALSQILSKIARMRHDWNGEVISLRSEDIKNLAIFSGFSNAEIEKAVDELKVSRLK